MGTKFERLGVINVSPIVKVPSSYVATIEALKIVPGG